MWDKLRKIKIVDGIMALGFLLVSVGVGAVVRDNSGDEVKLTKNSSPSPTIIIRSIKVDVEGEVINPGVYELKSNSRVEEALARAGGLGAEADLRWVEKNMNKAKLLMDGEKIYIPKTSKEGEGDEKVGTGNLAVTEASNQLISLNTASLEELDKLSGIGPGIGQRIIDYREENGGFKNIEEVKMVSGVGDKLYEKIKDQIGL